VLFGSILVKTQDIDGINYTELFDIIGLPYKCDGDVVYAIVNGEKV